MFGSPFGQRNTAPRRRGLKHYEPELHTIAAFAEEHRPEAQGFEITKSAWSTIS